MPKSARDQLQKTRPLTMQDIADRCGVSRVTVSRCLRGNRDFQSEETIARVLKTAAEMGYDPARGHAASRLASSKYGAQVLNYGLGLFFNHSDFVGSNYFKMVMCGVVGGIEGTDFEIYTSDWNHVEQIATLPRAYRRGDIDGVISLAQQSRWAETFQSLRSEPGFGNRPIVSVVEHLDGCSGVYPDNFSGAYAAMKHLIELGHKKVIHYIDEDPVRRGSVESQRLAGFYKALAEAGLDPLGVLVKAERKIYQSEETRDLLLQVVSDHPDATAIIAHDDESAVFLYKCLVRSGYKIPEDISLLSFDDTDPIYDAEQENILTTVRIPLRQIGFDATKLLIRRITGEEQRDIEIVVPTELIVRKTTAQASSCRALRNREKNREKSH